MQIKPGKYAARVVDAGLQMSQSNTLQAVMRFGFAIDGEPAQMNWYGSFSDKAKEYTIEALIKSGFQGTDIDDLRKGAATFDPSKEVEIVVEPHTYNEKTTMRIRYINIPGAASFKDLAPEATKGMSMKGDFMAARAKMGATNKKPTQTKETDVPF